MSIYESGQMYLETIYILSQKKSHVRAIDVGEQMGYSKPSVSRAMSLLKKKTRFTRNITKLSTNSSTVLKSTRTTARCRLSAIVSAI